MDSQQALAVPESQFSQNFTGPRFLPVSVEVLTAFAYHSEPKFELDRALVL